MAVGNDIISSCILVSPDGINWAKGITDLPTNIDGFAGVTWSGNHFLAMMADSYFQTSSGGTTWTGHTLQTKPTGRGRQSVTWGGGHFVAEGTEVKLLFPLMVLIRQRGNQVQKKLGSGLEI